ncbi:hypothetical protein WJX77_012337 [Trebouxia sp. C0004]
MCRSHVYAGSPQVQGEIRIAFIGAGGINFGSPEGPWNHSSRLQLLPDVTFSAIVDPNNKLAQERIDTLQKGEHGNKWKDTKVFTTYREMLEDSSAKPTAAFIGLPPMYHGALEDPTANIELEMAKAGVNLFVEKPLSVRPAAEVAQLAHELKHIQEQNNVVIAVGYMFRYSAMAQAAKKILKEHNATPLAVIARYACGYSDIKKRDWWDVSLCGGPIVEQATHFVDLMRFFAGEIIEDTVKAVAVGPQQKLSDMPEPPLAEAEVPMERRINRVTAAVWHFSSGAVGSLTHSLVLHTSHYQTELEILADGLHLILIDPYNEPKLKVRYPHSATYEEVPLDDRDVYLIEAEAFINAIKSGNTDEIQSLYEDSALSYQATQWITAASSQNIHEKSDPHA